MNRMLFSLAIFWIQVVSARLLTTVVIWVHHFLILPSLSWVKPISLFPFGLALDVLVLFGHDMVLTYYSLNNYIIDTYAKSVSCL